MEALLDCCPECAETRKELLINTAIWFECKTCGYTEDSFKGPVPGFIRQRDPNGPFTQYL
jgi:hypothetical protein